nr:keratinocyte proline-rich protein-like [Gorilla gorilla gorilla]
MEGLRVSKHRRAVRVGGSAVALRGLPRPQVPQPSRAPWPLAAYSCRPGPGRHGACCGRGAARPQLPVERLPELRPGTAPAPPASAATAPDPCPDPRGRPRPLPGPQRPPPSPARTPAAAPDPYPDRRGRPHPLPGPPRPPPSPAGSPAVSPVPCPVSCGRPCLLPGPCPVRRALPKVQTAPLQTRGRGHRPLGQALFLASRRQGERLQGACLGKAEIDWAAVKMAAAKEEAATWSLVGPRLIKTGVE